MQIFIRTISGKVLAVDVEPEMTIAELKKKIEAKHSIPIADLKLVFKGNQLKDTKTIDEAGIRKEDLINITKAPEEAKGDEIDVYIEGSDNPRTTMMLKLSDTIKEVMVKINNKFHMNLEKMTIYCKGQRLDETITIKEAGLKDKDVLVIVTGLRGGSL